MQELDINAVIMGCKPVINKCRTYMQLASKMNILNPKKTGLYILVVLLTVINIALIPVFTPINYIKSAWNKAKSIIFPSKRLV
jgi:hypothetical protein